MQSGFVTILGLPNAGKSTLLNALLCEKLAITSPKVQTTRHRIKGILNEPNYQLVISDTPGIIEKTEYKLHDSMMQKVKASVEDADVALLLIDVKGDIPKADAVFTALKLKVPTIVVFNKTDLQTPEKIGHIRDFFNNKTYAKHIIEIAALNKLGIENLIQQTLTYIPQGEPFYMGDELSDLPTKFFVQELIREKLYLLFKDEIPYQSTVLVTEYKEKTTLIKITANVIVQRESQKAIILGEGGQMIKKLGSLARIEIEKFLEQKVFLQLYVKARNKWRDSELFLKEYGY